MLKVKIKKLVKHAIIPKYVHKDDAGMDLFAIDKYKDDHYKFIEYGTGLAVQIPKGYMGLLFPRSSISKSCHVLSNSVGVIDSSYTGELKVRFRYDEEIEYLQYAVGDRVAQFIVLPYPKIEFEEVKELDQTERGDGGFGSSGK